MYMKRLFGSLLFALCCAASLASAQTLRVEGEPVWASATPQPALKLRHEAFPAADTAAIRFYTLDPARIDAVKTRNAVQKLKFLQIGITRQLQEESAGRTTPALKWNALAEGGWAARVVVSSPDARALRVGLNVRDIPSGAELRFAGSADPARVVAVVSGDEIKRLRREQPIYWTPITDGEQQIIEVFIPADANKSAFRYSVDSVSHLFVTPSGKLDNAKIFDSGACEIDVICPAQTEDYVNAYRSVARMAFQVPGGTALCVGTLLNDTDSSTQIPYFYSANHCISTQAEASTLNTYWFYERSGCGTGVLSSSAVQRVGGAQLLYNNPSSDVLLLKLNDTPPQGAFFAGWDANTILTGTSFTVVHHPNADVKKVSLGQVLGFITLNDPGDPGGNFITVGYTSASTEEGSSGSGLFSIAQDGKYFLRGGLFGGPASCNTTGNLNDLNNRDYYSRLDQSYYSVKQWLDPASAQVPDYTGAWYYPSESGWGVSIVRGASGNLGVVMYHFNQARQPIWYIVLNGSFNANVYSGTLYQYSGPWVGEPYHPALVSSMPVGTASISFTSSSAATLTYDINGAGSATKSISRLNF
jgi:lysyl endopeptidase